MTDENQPATLVENMLLLRKEDFDDLLDRAAEHRSRACARPSWLGKRQRQHDIGELRDLLEAWRDAHDRTAWQTTIEVITTGILAALLVGAAIKLKLMGGPQ